MPSQVILNLAARFGISLSDRSCTGNWVWDGQTLATYFNPYDYEAEDAAMSNGQRFDKSRLFLLPPQPLPEAMLAHEIGHWVSTPAWLRDLPDFGLDNVLAADKCMANGGYHLVNFPDTDEGFLRSQSYLEGVRSEEDQFADEAFAYLFGLAICSAYDIPLGTDVSLEWLPLYFVGGAHHLDSKHEVYRNRSHIVTAVRCALNAREATALDRLLASYEP